MYNIQVSIARSKCDDEKLRAVLSTKTDCRLRESAAGVITVSFAADTPDGGPFGAMIKRIIGSETAFVRCEKVYSQEELLRADLFWVFYRAGTFDADSEASSFDYNTGCDLCGANAIRNSRMLVVPAKLKGDIAIDASGLLFVRRRLLHALGLKDGDDSRLVVRAVGGPVASEWCEIQVLSMMPSLDSSSTGVLYDRDAMCSRCGIGGLFHSSAVPLEPKYGGLVDSDLWKTGFAVSREVFGRSRRDVKRKRIIAGARRTLLISQTVRDAISAADLKYLECIPIGRV